jgi:hypothetical protein
MSGLVVYKMAKAISEDREASEKRALSVYLKELSGENPYHVFQEMILNWAPRDVRLEPTYSDNHCVRQTDSEFMRDVFRGISTKIIDKLPAENRFTVGVYFQSNMAEFEKYNAIVRQHNELWEKAGKPHDDFDPVTGDIKKIEDTHVQKAIADSPFAAELRIMRRKGPLGKAAPKIERALMLTVEFSIEVIDNSFVVSFIAMSTDDKILYHNVIQEKDMGYLARRITQELFGNHLVKGDTGPFLEGISHLLQGRKVSLAYKNVKPYFAQGCNNYKGIDGEKAVGTVAYHILAVLTKVFQIVLPVFLAGFAIYRMFLEIVKDYEDQTGSYQRWVLTLLVCFLSIWVSGKISQFLAEKRDTYKHKLKFI